MVIIESKIATGPVATREDKIKAIVDDIMEKLPEPFNMSEIMGKVEERTPYVVVAFQVAHVVFFYKMGQPRPLFVYFRSFQTQIVQKKNVVFSGIRTQIVGVEGKHVDHLTTTTTARLMFFKYLLPEKL